MIILWISVGSDINLLTKSLSKVILPLKTLLLTVENGNEARWSCSGLGLICLYSSAVFFSPVQLVWFAWMIIP